MAKKIEDGPGKWDKPSGTPAERVVRIIEYLKKNSDKDLFASGDNRHK